MKSCRLLGMCLMVLFLSGCCCKNAATPETQAAESVCEQKCNEIPSQITMKIGESRQVSLLGNPTTGYVWHVVNNASQIVQVAGGEYQTDNTELCGAGGTFTWKISALAAGSGEVIFRYYRDWEGFKPGIDKEIRCRFTVEKKQ